MGLLIDKRPAPGRARPYDFPEFSRARLGSGLTLIAVNIPDRPLGAAVMVVDAGAEHESPSEGGVAALAARSLTEGTENYEGAEFIDAAERIGAELHASAGWDSFAVDVQVPMARLEPALELLAEAVLRPSFPEREVERLKKERINSLMQEFADPSRRAEHAFREAVYTPASPYSRPSGGTSQTVEDLTRSKVDAFYREFATPASATLIVAGDLGGFPLGKIAESLFGDWEAAEPDPRALEVKGAITETTVTLVNRPGSVQSHLVLGHVGVPRRTPDYFPLSVGTTALGGIFSSRLNLKLREEKGYTYGARADFAFRRGPGPFRVVTPVQSEVTIDAIADILEILRNVSRDGLTEEEITASRDYRVGVFPLSLETPDAVAGALSMLPVYGLPDDYFTTFRDNLAAVTTAQANQALTSRVHPDRLAIVVVGDAEQIAGPLREAGFGPVEVIEDPPLQDR